MEHAKSYRDLIVYRMAQSVSRRLFVVSRQFPQEERYALTDQARCSSRSIGAQIAEAWAKRRYERHFASKLTDADGEQLETQHWLDTALDCGYLGREDRDEMVGELEQVGRMLQSMINKADLFCSAPSCQAKEDVAPCYAEPKPDHRGLPQSLITTPITDH